MVWVRMHPEHAKVLHAAGYGVAVWIAIYFVLIHVWVVWKWQSLTAITVDASHRIGDPGDWDLHAAYQEHERVLEEIETLIEELEDARDRIPHQVQNLHEAVEELEVARETFDSFSVPSLSQLLTTTLASPEDSVSLDGLAQVWNRSTLGVLAPDSLDEFNYFMDAARDNLYQHWDNSDTVDWLPLVRLFQQTARTEPPAETACGDTPVVPDAADLATPQDLVHEIALLRASIQNRRQREGFVVLQPSTKARLDGILARDVQAWIQYGPARTSDKETRYEGEINSSCVSTPLVLPWIEAGLDALHRGQDLNTALLRAVARDDYDPSTLILDAVWTPATPAVRDGPSTLNLRTLLDRPLTHQLSHVLDRVVDATGGYIDALDQRVDALPADWVSQFMTTVRKAAGRVNVPVPDKLRRALAV